LRVDICFAAAERGGGEAEGALRARNVGKRCDGLTVNEDLKANRDASLV
jgi:hypothetical protein